mgnify:CR=1 FL=1
MFYRFLGKFFLFFVIAPAINRAFRFAAPIAADTMTRTLVKQMTENDKDLARARATHPAGSRL